MQCNTKMLNNVKITRIIAEKYVKFELDLMLQDNINMVHP